MEEDLIDSGSAREPLRACCHKLAQMSWSLYSTSKLYENEEDSATRTKEMGSQPLSKNLGVLKRAVVSVISASSTENAAKAGRLDDALCDLVQSLDSYPLRRAAEAEKLSLSRMEALECIVAAVEAAAMWRFQIASADTAATCAIESSRNIESMSVSPRAGGGDDVEKMEQEVYDASVNPEAVALSSSLRALAETIGIEDMMSHASSIVVASSIEARVKEVMAKLPDGFFDAIVTSDALSDAQKKTLSEVDEALQNEYALRRRVLLERADLTLKSFLCARKLAENEQAKHSAELVSQKMLKGSSLNPRVGAHDVFNATLADVMTVTERATSSSWGDQEKESDRRGSRGEGDDAERATSAAPEVSGRRRGAAVKAILIGSVPDRGGRAEGRLRAAMPAWSARASDDGHRGGSRGKGRKSWHHKKHKDGGNKKARNGKD